MTRKPLLTIPLTLVQFLGWSTILSIGLFGMSHSAIAQVLFEPPTGEEEPSSTTGAASRGLTCIAPNQALIALKPSGTIGLTLEAHPAIWIDLPPNTAERISLSLLTETRTLVYEDVTFPVPDTAGPVALQLPQEQLPLEIGQRYEWIVELECDLNNASKNLSVSGWVKRIEPDPQLQQELDAAENPLEQAEVYASHGIWYETLSIVAAQQQANPKDAQVMAAWRSLLEWIDLEPAARMSSSEEVVPNRNGD
jgi:Domain of Unknown Function (DUF928)